MNDQRTCLRDPIPEIFDAARYLDGAVSAHLTGNRKVAEELIRLSDMPVIRDWTESLWGKGGPWSRPLAAQNAPVKVAKADRIHARMPNKAGLAALIARDGFHCRFCGIPVVRAEVRSLIRKAYPDALPWAIGNANQHAGFQALWLTYDHLLPYSRGGSSELDTWSSLVSHVTVGDLNGLLRKSVSSIHERANPCVQHGMVWNGSTDPSPAAYRLLSLTRGYSS